jgi:hypothetical protein
MGGAPTVLYSGPTAKNVCVSKKCHDGRLDAAITAKFAAAAAAAAAALAGTAAAGTGTAATGGADTGSSSVGASVQP